MLGTTDMGTYVQFDVAPAVQGTPGVGEFTFTVEEPTPLTIVRDVDYWQPFPGVVGLYSQDGSGLAVSQDAFGVDLYFQEMAFSGDWDVMVAPVGGATVQGRDPLVFQKVYHDTESAINPSGNSFNEPLNPAVTMDFTNPYPYPIKVLVTYVPHLYLKTAFDAYTVYFQIEKDGWVPDSDDPGEIAHIARQQRNGQSGIWYTGIYVEAIYRVEARQTVTFEVMARQSTGADGTTNYAYLTAQMLGPA